MKTYYQVLISAENTRQANVILDALLKKKLVLGGPVIRGPARFWWKGKIVKMNYSYIITYTDRRLKNRVVSMVEKVSEEEVPMVSFIPMEGNTKLVRLLNKTLKTN